MSRAHTVLIAVLSSAVTAVTVAGTAVAVTSSGTQVNACVNKKTGAVRVVKKCSGSEKKLALGTVGPQGPAGKAGAAGAPGTPGAPGQPGATGPSDIYSWAASTTGGAGTGGGTLPTLGSGPPTPLAVIPALPAGTWSVHLDASATSSTQSPGEVYCSLSYAPTGKSAVSGQTANVFVPTAVAAPLATYFSAGSASVTDTVTLSATAAVSLSCVLNPFGNPALTLASASVTAVRPGTMHTSTGAFALTD